MADRSNNRVLLISPNSLTATREHGQLGSFTGSTSTFCFDSVCFGSPHDGLVRRAVRSGQKQSPRAAVPDWLHIALSSLKSALQFLDERRKPGNQWSLSAASLRLPKGLGQRQ